MSESKTFYFSDGPYLQVMQSLHAALSMPEAFIKLVGHPQTGKSLLCEKFSQFLTRKDYKVIYFDTAIESPDILRALLAREFDLPESSNFARLLEDSLRIREDKPIVLIFDDAHLLTDVTLLEIYRLAEVQVDTKRMLNIVLCGEPSLEKRLLSNKEFKSLLLNVSHRFQLEPMNIDELGRFFYRYLEKAGMPGLQLDNAAMNAFYKACKGYPGAALSMCRLLATSRRQSAGLEPITKQEFQLLLKQAASDELMPRAGYLEQYRLFSRIGPVVPIATVLIIASLGVLYQQLEQQAVEEGGTEALMSEGSPFAAEISDDPISEVIDEPIADATLTESIIADSTDSSMDSADAEVSVATRGELAEDTPDIAAQPTLVLLQVEEPVSDSSLALVTAQERGVATDAISIPDFEDFVTEEIQTESTEEEEVTEALNLTTESEIAEIRLEVEDLEAVEEVEPMLQDAPAIGSAVSGLNEQSAEDMAENGDIADDTEELVAVLYGAVDEWVTAWETQSMSDYFASYHSEFSPRYQDTQAEWRSNRQRVISGASSIKLELSEFQYVGVEEGMLEVRFWLRYESPTYSDNTQKKLLFLQEQGSWKIKEEINLQVRS